MNLDLSPADRAFRDEVHTFVRTQLPYATRDTLRAGRPATAAQIVEWQRILNRRGWGAPRWPAEWGGTGWNALQRLLFLEALHLNFAPDPPGFNVNMLGPVLIHFGTDTQKHRFLERARNLDDWWCQGFSEPGAGSDLASLKTSARRDGDDFIVNGQKIWTTLAQHADWMFCLVRTDPAQKKQRGISFLLLDMRSPGVTVRPIITLDGRHEVNEVFLDNVRVPADQLVGAENEGWTIAKFLLTYERTSIARVGLSKVALAQVRRELPALREPRRGAIERRLCQLEVELRALELTQYRLLCQADANAPADPRASILKLMGSEVRQASSELLMEVAGARAQTVTSGTPYAGAPYEEALDRSAQNYFSLRAASIYGGASEIQKNIIAQSVLQLP